ncbi:hypothetical protein FRC08_015664 [Ceratobasidium sp. 394]|nr:hypothetical protein FRC08_015664 [Ceratobasidium sp. 394]
MNTRDFPDEILLDIAHYIGICSSHELRSLALVDRRWYLVAAPQLLATIRVSSLGDLVRLCDHLASAHVAQNFLLGHPIANGHNYVSMIEHHTRGIVISGERWPHGIGVVADYYTGLDKYQPPAGNGPLTAPDVEIKYQDMLSKLGASMPHLKQLGSLEWYGRFPGDYYLVNYLLQTRILSRLSLCIDNGRVKLSPSFCNIALGFKRLKHFNLETASGDHSPALIHSTVSLLHRSPGLERLVISSTHSELFSKSISNSPVASESPFIWPNLRYLKITFVEASFWGEPKNVDLFARFLSAHRQLEVFIMNPCSYFYYDAPQLRSFSLTPYSDPLPNLKHLHASLPIIVGILENANACPSLTTLVDSGTRQIKPPALEPVLETLLQLLERISYPGLRRVCINVPQIQYGVFQRLSKVVPGVQILEIQSFGSEMSELAPKNAQLGDMLAEIITLGLGQFPRLHTVGGNITSIYNRAYAVATNSPLPFNEHMLRLAEAVPKIRFIHVGNGALLAVLREPNQTPRLGWFDCMDNIHGDWKSTRLWRTRPMSPIQEEICRKNEYEEECMHLFEVPESYEMEE